jgi:CspA family cold shock protein
LHPSCTWSEASGYSFIEKGKRHTWLVFKDGYQVQFKSGTQDAKSLESGTIDAIFFDEPPKPGHWAAGRMRVSVGNGPTLIGFTAVNAPLGWLKKEVEGDPESGMAPAEVWEKIVIILSMQDSPHRTIEDIEAQKKKAAAQGQTEQRINGGWEGLTLQKRPILPPKSYVTPPALRAFLRQGLLLLGKERMCIRRTANYRPCLATAAAFDLDVTAPGHRIPADGRQTGVHTMAKGTVKWFNATKGFGFIAPEGGKKDVFVHITAMERAGIRQLADGQAVTFDIEAGRDGRESAINLALA